MNDLFESIQIKKEDIEKPFVGKKYTGHLTIASHAFIDNLVTKFADDRDIDEEIDMALRIKIFDVLYGELRKELKETEDMLFDLYKEKGMAHELHAKITKMFNIMSGVKYND